MSFDVWCSILFIRAEEGAGPDGDEETEDMKASLHRGGFNLSQKAYPRTQINASECHTQP